jgi:hypothetical protein
MPQRSTMICGNACEEARVSAGFFDLVADFSAVWARNLSQDVA